MSNQQCYRCPLTGIDHTDAGKWPADTEIVATEARGRVGADTELRACGVSYDRRRRKVVLTLTNGCMFAFPPGLVKGLQTASDDEIAEVELIGLGSGLHWERRDVDLSVAGLMAGRFG